MHITTNNDRRGGWARRAGAELVQTLSVASQMALLCPSGMDEWARRERDGRPERDQRPSPYRR